MANKSIEQRLDEIEATLLKAVARFEVYDTKFEAYDSKLDAYQKASNQIVNLAFSLLITAVLSIIIPAVLRG